MLNACLDRGGLESGGVDRGAAPHPVHQQVAQREAQRAGRRNRGRGLAPDRSTKQLAGWLSLQKAVVRCLKMALVRHEAGVYRSIYQRDFF